MVQVTSVIEPIGSEHPLCSAEWIWPAMETYPYNRYAHFRRDFELPDVPGDAALHITADQMYVLYVNGGYVGRGPARGYQAHWPFDMHDVAPLLRKGKNWISVIAYNAGVSTYQYLHQTKAGFLCALEMDGDRLVSDGEWRGRLDESHKRYTARLSVQLNFQEAVDARLDDRQWIESATPPGEDWGQPLHVVPFGVMPWHTLEPRGIANLGNRLLAYKSAIAHATGKCGAQWREMENLKEAWLAERSGLIWEQETAAQASSDGLSFTVPATGAGNFHAVLLDLGRPSIGTFCLDVAGASGGEVIDLFACEWLDDDGGPHVPGTRRDCEASMSARLVLREDRTRWEAVQMIGHRYLTVIVRESDRPLTIACNLRETVYPMDVTGAFDCGDQELNDIYGICVNTQRICALDAYVDTPWREQAQWWGDARVQSWNTFHLSNDAGLLQRGIQQIAGQSAPNGLTYGHAPTIAHHCILPDFSIIWLLTLYDHYFQTGRTDLFESMWPRVQRVLDYFDTEGRGDHGLLIYDKRYWLFLDWADIHKEGAPTLLNLWYYHAMDKLAEVADKAGQREAHDALAQRRDMIAPLIMDRLFDAEAGLFHDGLTSAGEPVVVHSIHNQTLALLSGLASEAHEQMREQRLLPYLEGKAIEGAQPSSYWVTYVYSVMREAGYDRAVIEHIRKHWGPMVSYGGCSEMFTLDAQTHRPEPGYVGTFSHAWAAHPIYHLAGSVGGIVQAEPGWDRVCFRPLLGATDRCNATIPTPHGLIHVRWQLRGEREYAVELALPKGVTADIDLPGVDPASVTGVKSWRVRI